MWGQLHLSKLLWEMFHTLLVVKLRLVRGWLLFFKDRIPVNASKPRVCHDLFCITLSRPKSFVWIFIKEFGTNIACIFAQKWIIKSRLVIFDVSEQFLLVLVVKGWLAAQHLIDNASE